MEFRIDLLTKYIKFGCELLVIKKYLFLVKLNSLKAIEDVLSYFTGRCHLLSNL
jgi:hypothetical protein